MTFTHQQNILYKEFLDEYIGEHTLDNFIEWCKYEVGPANLTEVTDSEVKTPTPVNANNPRPASETEVADPNTPTRPVGATEEYPHTMGRRVVCLTGQQWYDRFNYEITSWADGAYSNDVKTVLRAAKLAAGLGEGHNE